MAEKYSAWETVWHVLKLGDGEHISSGRDYATREEAQAVADGLTSTETQVVSSRQVRRDPLPAHLSTTWDEIETGFHEYAAQVSKEESQLVERLGADFGRSFAPEFADWAVGMKAAQEWLAAHDAEVRRTAEVKALRDAADWLDTFGNSIPAMRLRDRAKAIDIEEDRA